VVLAVLSTASGAAADGLRDLERFTSRSYVIHTNLSKAEAVEYGAHMDLVYASYRRQFRSLRGGLQYAQSWLIVHFLAHGDGGRYTGAFDRYLVELSSGRDHTVAFRSAFGTLDTAPFARRWLAFLDDARPDNFSEAVNRVQFLGAGMLATQNNGAWPATLDELKTRMTDQDFELEYVSDAGKQTLAASDDKWYGYIDDAGDPQPFVTQETPAPRSKRRTSRREATPDDAPLPPTLVAEGLSPPVHLTWKYDPDGRLQPRVEYPSARRRR